MKAKIYYKDFVTQKRRVKTIEVPKNEPNEIIREFVRITKVSRFTYITNVKCGRYDYQWKGIADEAFAKIF